MSGWQGVYLHDIAEELKNIREVLEKQTTIDIVRCEDCIHGRKDSNRYKCEILNEDWILFKPTHFCSMGERKEQ